jgi:rhodanese-related sulfurtransferase
MGLLGYFKPPDIDWGVEDFRDRSDAVLLDVRTPQEYEEGHIPGSRNVPLHQLRKVTALTQNKETALYVYCHSGARSRQAVSLLRHMGYSDVRNIGGILSYSGELEN